jgi:hypothetical protein
MDSLAHFDIFIFRHCFVRMLAGRAKIGKDISKQRALGREGSR